MIPIYHHGYMHIPLVQFILTPTSNSPINSHMFFFLFFLSRHSQGLAYSPPMHTLELGFPYVAVDLPIENGGSFHSHVKIYQRLHIPSTTKKVGLYAITYTQKNGGIIAAYHKKHIRTSGLKSLAFSKAWKTQPEWWWLCRWFMVAKLVLLRMYRAS